MANNLTGLLKNKVLASLTSRLSVFEKFNIVCILGADKIQNCKLTPQGMLELDGEAIAAPGRLLSFKNDEFYRTGVFVITDKEASKQDYRLTGETRLYQYPLNRVDGAEYSLYTLITKKFYFLLSSHQSRCVNFDSQYSVLSPNMEMFCEEDERDPVRVAFSEE